MDNSRDAANQLLDYLLKCADRSEKINLIAAYLEREFSRGELSAVTKWGKKLDAMRAEMAR